MPRGIKGSGKPKEEVKEVKKDEATALEETITHDGKESSVDIHGEA